MAGRTPIKLIILAMLILAISACSTEATALPNESALTSSSAPSNDAQGNKTQMKDQRVLNVAMTFLDEPPDPYQAGWLAVPTGLSET